MLELDEQSHEYRWHGKRVPGVTSIIRGALGDPFSGISPAVLANKRQIGLAAHKAWELDDNGELDEDSVDAAVSPYLEAWRSFRREFKCSVLLNETKLYHHIFGYAGTLDRVMTLDSLGLALVDGKTGFPGALAAIQTAGYAELVRLNFATDSVPILRFSLQTLPTGRYKFEQYCNPGDFADFLACLRCVRLREAAQ